MQTGISIIVPVLNEESSLPGLIDNLRSVCPDEVIWVDGGSTDRTRAIIERHSKGGRVISSPPGRARQMNAGAAAASGSVLVFLHADTRLPEGCTKLLSPVSSGTRAWGRFDVCFDDPGLHMRMVAALMNLRSKITGIATGDQAIFVRTTLFDNLSGYADIPLMEDVEISRRLKRAGRPHCIQTPVSTSSRRWREHGFVRTILLMWFLRLGFFLGISPARLARWYRSSP